MCILTCAHREARHGRTCTRTTPLHELYETPTRYTRCAYFNDLINCRHGQYVQWLSSLYRFSHLSPKIIRRPFFLRLSFFFLSSFFFFIIRAPLEIGLLGYKGNNQRRVEKYEIFFDVVIFVFLLFFLCFFFEKNLKS